MTLPSPTTHDEQLGLSALRSDRAQRLSLAKSVLAHPADHDDDALRRACTAIMAHSRDHTDRTQAEQLLATLNAE